MPGCSEDSLPAKVPDMLRDTLIVGRHNHLIQALAFDSLLVHPVDHRLAFDHNRGLPGKRVDAIGRE